MSQKSSLLVQNIVPFGLRMQPDLRTLIESAIAATGRSMNAEICVRLQRSFESDADKVDELLTRTQEILDAVRSLEKSPARK